MPGAVVQKAWRAGSLSMNRWLGWERVLIRTRRFPSPQPSPLGRGRPVRPVQGPNARWKTSRLSMNLKVGRVCPQRAASLGSRSPARWII